MNAVETYILFVAPLVVGLAGLAIYLLAAHAPRSSGRPMHPGE